MYTNSVGFANLSPDEFETALAAANTQLIDVRSAAEFESGHLPNAVNMDISSPTFLAQMQERTNKLEPLYLYCRSGVRSASACDLLAQYGFTHLYNLSGGIMGWNAAVVAE
jgi:rhodanese-related sulfurtransferase